MKEVEMERLKELEKQEKDLMRLLAEVREQIQQEQEIYYRVYCQQRDTNLEQRK
jgi:hypothetical protein